MNEPGFKPFTELLQVVDKLTVSPLQTHLLDKMLDFLRVQNTNFSYFLAGYHVTKVQLSFVRPECC